MAPSATKRRATKKEGSKDDPDLLQPARSGLNRRQRMQRVRFYGFAVLLIFVLMLFGWILWQEASLEAQEFARIVGCGWEECADPKKKDVLQAVADMAATHKTNMDRELSPQRAMWSFCLKTCIDSPKEPSPSAMAEVKHVLQVADAQKSACSYEASWTIDLASIAGDVSSMVHTVERILSRCGLVRILGMWEAKDYEWMEQSLSMYKYYSPEDILSYGRVETTPRRTEDVLVLLDHGKLAPQVWKGIARFMSQPVLVGSIAKYFNTSGSPRLSYTSWIAAPPAGKSSKVQPQKIHSDLDTPKSMVSVHLALEDVTTSMGPTGYCPGTHRPGEDTTTNSTGVAGPLELHFARRYVALTKNTDPCVPIVPSSTRKGTVTIYDSALVHRGESNTAAKTRVLLNLNIAASTKAIEEENYIDYFKRKPTQADMRTHLAMIRKHFGADFFKELVQLGSVDGGSHAHHDGEALTLRALEELDTYNK